MHVLGSCLKYALKNMGDSSVYGSYDLVNIPIWNTVNACELAQHIMRKSGKISCTLYHRFNAFCSKMRVSEH